MARSKEAIRAAQVRYEHSGALFRKTILLHSTKDADLIEYIKSLDNFNATMKDLLRSQISKQ